MFHFWRIRMHIRDIPTREAANLSTVPAPMAEPSSHKVASRARRWKRGIWAICLAALVLIPVQSWRSFTKQRAVHQLEEIGFSFDEPSLGRTLQGNLQPLRTLHYWKHLLGNHRSLSQNSGTPPAWTAQLRDLDTYEPALRRLNPHYLSVRDFSALENLDAFRGSTALRYVSFERCFALRDIGSLSRSTSLHTVVLPQSAVTNIDALRGHTQLLWVDLRGCTALQNVDGLRGPKRIYQLNLANCAALQNVDGLEGLTSLRDLQLNGCTSLQNVNGLKGLAALQDLQLNSCVHLRNVDGLAGLTSLRWLQLKNCTALHDVDALKGLKSLEIVNLSGCTGLTPEAILALKAALPHTRFRGLPVTPP
jgi:hypothetical protein